MDSSKELVLKIPILDEGNYAIWKMKMSMAIRAIGDDAWEAVEEGWSPPTVIGADGNEMVKPRSQWTLQEKNASKYNSKALFTICGAVTESQFQTIQCCTSAKDAWDRLESTYEGTSSVKTMRLDMLASQFELLRMDENETIDQFSTKLRGIAMESQVLGKKYKDKKLVKKLLRCLPARFESKKTAMGTALDTNNMTFDVAVGHLLTYELERKSSVASDQLAFVADDRMKLKKMEEEMALMVKNFRKWNKRDQRDQKGESSSRFKPSWNDSRGVDRQEKEEPRCHECQGFGHFKATCATARKKEEIKCGDCKGFGHTSSECSNNQGKQKAYLVEESDSDDSDEDDEMSTGFVAFPAIIGESDCSDSESDGEVIKSVDTNSNVDVSQVYEDLQTLGKEKLQWLKEKIELEEQNDNLKCLLTEEQNKNKSLENLMSQNQGLLKQLEEEQQRANRLESELTETMKKVQMLNSGTKELDKILTVGRISKIPYGLGYDGRSGKENTGFVRARKNHQEEMVISHTRSKGCYFCGNFGHIKRYCYHFQRKVKNLVDDGQYFPIKNRWSSVWIKKDDLYGKTGYKTSAQSSQKQTVITAALMASSQVSKKCWYFDSGASIHMTGVQNVLDDYSKIEESKVKFGGGAHGTIKGRGKLTTNTTPDLDNVYFVEGLKTNLISVSQLCDEGLTVIYKGAKCICTDTQNNTVMSGIRYDNNCYMWEQNNEMCLKASSEKDKTVLQHQEQEHMNEKTMAKSIMDCLTSRMPIRF